VDANLFHDFHQTWSISIRNALNAGLLPPGYSALVEQHAGGLVPDAVLAARGNRIVIHHRLGDVVCVIEIVSPGNKCSRNALRSFVQKTTEFLRQGIHLLVIDLLPPTRRDPQGIHKAIWDEIDEDDPFELAPDKRLTLAGYVAGDPLAELDTIAYVEPFGVGDTLADMPAYLDRDGYVPVPLEATYQSAWASCPADFRELVETGKLPGEEE
jgi:hypothetical protein